jgi:putative ATP-grasp target RiPP
MTANDVIREGDHFPLGSPMAPPKHDDEVATPFGLRFATTPNEAAIFEPDFTKISYDQESQTATFTEDDGSVIQAGRHTSTKTTTSTASRDRSGNDSDTDSAGD